MSHLDYKRRIQVIYIVQELITSHVSLHYLHVFVNQNVLHSNMMVY